MAQVVCTLRVEWQLPVWWKQFGFIALYAGCDYDWVLWFILRHTWWRTSIGESFGEWTRLGTDASLA